MMQELRGSVRFPIKLPVSLNTEGAPHTAQTTDISAGGVLFEVDRNMAVGSSLSFRIAMPAEILGTPNDVVVSCAGRVVRCAEKDGRKSVAAIIDEYHFERAEAAVR